MSVSQYLRPENLVDSVKSYLTPDVVRSASSLVGESESSTFHAMHGAVPGLLGGLLNYSSTPERAGSLAGMLRDGGFSSALENPASLFGGGSMTSSMISTGQSLIGKIFGNKAASVSEAVGSASGVRSSSATTLMSLLAPLTMGVVGKMAGPNGLNAAGITNLLQGQKREIAAATPPGISHILGFGGGPVAAPTPSALYEEKAAPTARKWLPTLLVALAVLGLLGYLLSRGRGPAEQAISTARGALTSLSLPGGGSLSVPEGSINYNLAHFLASGSQDLPKTFVFDHLNFETGSAQVTPDSVQTVNDLSTILKAYPNARIQLAGHTDNTGSAQANQQLSLDRANAVRTMLVSAGIGADRISTIGYGQDRPVASNDSEEGRARNRRTELTVASK
jgi:outer membrane protein OmpA-like peptidoglycan-associated protein